MTEGDNKGNKAKCNGDHLSLTSPLSEFYIEGRKTPGGISILLGGVVSIFNSSAEEIELKTVIGKIKLKGSKLTISIYERNSIEIKGHIEEVIVNYGNNR